MSKKKSKRPPKPANSTRSKKYLLSLTPAEDAELRQAAAEAGLTIRDYLVDRSLHARRLAQVLAAAESAQ